jgi:NAD(P)-dependent dehydrogenase (short-subunit alcohol dehydrogenase family)
MTWRRAVVVGASGGIGRALSEALEKNGTEVVRLSRSAEGSGRIDLENEASIAQAADSVSDGGDVDLVLVASGILAPDEIGPEKSWRGIDPAAMARVFAVNAIGPALVAKHFVPLLPKDRRSAFAFLGARVGSIGDNRLGGWYSYRASKAALAQIVRTLSIELARTHPLATCVALHPGTVATRLSERFARDATGPDVSARHLLAVLGGLGPDDAGGHFDWKGERIAP